MAGDWIKMRGSLLTNTKVAAMARHLSARRDFMDWWSHPQQTTCDESVTEVVTLSNVTRVTVAGLLSIWSSVNGTINADDVVPIMAICDVDSVTSIPGFGEAMESVNWVEPTGAGGLRFPNFKEFNAPDTVRRTKTGAERTADWRARLVTKCDENVTPCDGCDVEKRREEKKKKNTPLPPKGKTSDSWKAALDAMTGVTLKTDTFREVWSDWVTHRKEIKKPVTATSAKQQIRLMESWGEERAVAAMRHTIAKGWQGLREPELGDRVGRAEAKPGKYDNLEVIHAPAKRPS